MIYLYYKLILWNLIRIYYSLKRIEQSYNFMFKGSQDANDEDIILLSDNYEIPNLKKLITRKKKSS